MASKKESTIKSSGMLVGCTMLASGFGLVTQFVYARAFGTSYKMDALWLSLSIITVFQLGIFAAFNPTLVPALAQLPEDTQERDALLKKFLLLFGAAAALLVGLLALFADAFIGRLAPGFSAEQRELTVTLFRIQLPTILFLTIYATVATSFYARKHFTPPSMSVLINGSVILLAAIVLIPRLGIHGATLGYPVAYFLQMAVFLPSLLRIGRAPMGLVSRAEFSRVLRTLGWLLLVAVLLNLYVALERNIASHLPEGAVSYLGYGYRFIVLLNMIFVTTLAVYLLPQFSESLQGDDDGRGEAVLTAYKMSTLVSAPLVLGGIACIRYVIFLFLQHGAFTAEDTRQLTYTIWAYGLGAFVMGNGSTLTSAIHALRRPKSLILAATGALVAWLPVALWASRAYGHLGIAGSYAVYAITLVFLQCVYLRWKVGLGIGRATAFTAVNVALGALVWGGFTRLAPQTFGSAADHGAYVGLAALGFALHYAALWLVFRRERAAQKVLINFRSVLGRA